MTEEVDRRHGVNGNSSSKGASVDAPVHGATLATSGGRLKFFKDGKFILELVRGCGREGERSGWVSVPRKTVSDDNSSIQSSPWQRDHCWKQAAPRRNLSKELAMYYCRPATLLTPVIAAASRAKRRRPYDTTHQDSPPNGLRRLTNGVCDKKRNGDADSPGDDAVDGSSNEAKPRPSDDDRWADYDREKYYHMKLKKPYQYHKLRVYKKTRSAFRRKELTRITDKLRERIAALPAPVNAKLASCRQEHMMVSPRKRILRELERVSLEDQGMKRRAKTVPALSTASYPPSPGPSHAAKPPAHNGTARSKEQPAKSSHVSSYSIHSLLSMPDESAPRRSPDAKRSPHSYPASLKTESPSSVHSPDLSPSPDNYRYRYSALTLGSPGPAGVARDSPTPPSELARNRGGYAPPAPPSPYGVRYGSATPGYRGSPSREEYLPYVYGYGMNPLQICH
ncbi:protein hairless [Phthorimaea operculella]|nr:protein hairless [Phthorimaea operculella]